MKSKLFHITEKNKIFQFIFCSRNKPDIMLGREHVYMQTHMHAHRLQNNHTCKYSCKNPK